MSTYRTGNHWGVTIVREAVPPDDSCTCANALGRAVPECPVHQGRRARGPKPPNPPGCICDGSGRTCPRHGVVI